MFHHRIILAILLGLSSQCVVADSDLNHIKSSSGKDDVYEMMRSLVEQAISVPVIEPLFFEKDEPCECTCEVEPGTAGVIITIEEGGLGIGGKVGQLLNFCIPEEYEQYIFDFFARFPNLPQPTCAPSDDCPVAPIPVPIPDPSPECECTCDGDGKVEDGVIIQAQPYLFHLCIPASWSAFFLVVPSIIFPILQLPSNDFKCADASPLDDKGRASKEKGCPTKLVIPLPLPAFPNIGDKTR